MPSQPFPRSGRRFSGLLLAGTATVATALVVIGACAGGKVPDVPLELPGRQGFWQIHPASPVIRGGDFFDKSLWNDPSVLKTADGYVMYMTSSTKEPFKPPVLPFRAVSKDGIKWQLEPRTPLLDVSGTPFVSLETPSVVFYKGQYHMYFSAVYKAGNLPAMEIGHATSPDGIRWTKDTKPVITATAKVVDWNGFAVAEPGAIVYNDKIYVYFTAMGQRAKGTPEQHQHIGLATSSDGTRFDAPRPVLGQTKTYPAEKGFPGYSTPAALVDGKTIHLFYDIVHVLKNAKPEWRQVALHHAVSSDGGLTFVEDRNALLRRDDTPWARTGEVNGPAAIIDGNEVKLWFGSHGSYDDIGNMIKRGWKGPEFGIGLVTTGLAQLRQPNN